MQLVFPFPLCIPLYILMTVMCTHLCMHLLLFCMCTLSGLPTSYAFVLCVNNDGHYPPAMQTMPHIHFHPSSKCQTLRKDTASPLDKITYHSWHAWTQINCILGHNSGPCKGTHLKVHHDPLSAMYCNTSISKNLPIVPNSSM